jgi:lipoprotein-anchoring transpeptidase ErfK/SrfK
MGEPQGAPLEEEAQAKAGPGGRDTIGGPAPRGSSGRPLAAATRSRMERAFGHDFSAVRVHTDAPAHAYVAGAGAHAAALGTDIYARSDAGIERQPWLLAHELAHVVQQSGHRGGGAQPAGLAEARTSAFEHEADSAASQVAAGGQASVRMRTGAATPQMYAANLCGRASTQFPDFPDTHISAIHVDVGTQQVTLTWTGPNAAQGRTGPFHCSPGAGKCGRNCNDTEASNRNGSHCTPKGSFTVQRFACALGGHPEAENATYFQTARGIAFHFYPSVPNCPASHGCVRVERTTSELIHDNARIGTRVTVGGTWARGDCRCW